MKYISIKAAARLCGMEYERFRWWVINKRGPKYTKVLGRYGFIAEDVKAWKPQYSPNRGGDRSKGKKKC